jgi:hypothetical protein
MYRLIVLLMAVGLVLGGMQLSWAQPAPAPLVPARPAPPPSPTPAPVQPTVSGTVQQDLLTPHGEVEGLLLADGTIVRFPPHLSVALASTVKPGEAVTVAGFLVSTTAQGQAVKALTITNTATGQTVVDQPPASRPLPPELRGLPLTPLTVRGTVARLLVNDHGDVDGLILSSGEEVKFRPPNGATVVILLGQQPGAIVQASGYGTRNAFGTVVDADSITVGSQIITLR